MDTLVVNLGSSPPNVNEVITKLTEGFVGSRGEKCALVASNLIGAWKGCIDALAGKSAPARVTATTINLLADNALETFVVGDEATATKCASSASGILSKIFEEDTLARLLANYARGNDDAAMEDNGKAVTGFNDAYARLTAALEKVTAPAADEASP
jgi:hypothetical protein